MKRYEVTLWLYAIPDIGFHGCYSYETVTASCHADARRYAKEHLLSIRGYMAKIISIRIKRS